MPGSQLVIADKMASRQGGQLNKKDLAAVQNYLARATHKWVDIGVQLELDPEYLENLRSNKKSSDKDNMRRMILTWLKGEEVVPTWTSLCAALRAAAVDEVAIADKIEGEKLPTTDKVEEESIPTAHKEEKDQDTNQASHDDLSTEIQENVSRRSSTNESTGISETTALPAVLEPFPHLNVSGLSANEKVALSERLLQESLMLRLVFTSLISDTEASLLQRKINAIEIQEELKSSNFFHHKTVAGVGSVEEVLGCLGEYWGVCDYSILEYIILKLGIHKDRENLKDYQESLAEFAGRRIFECPVRMFGTSLGEAEVAVTVKRMDKKTILYDTTLNQVKIFSAILKREMDVDGSDMRLIAYQKDGDSLELEFGMLASLADIVFPLSSEKKEKLISLGVWLVSCGDCVFQQQLQTEEDEVDAGRLSDEDGIMTESADTKVDIPAADEPIAVFASTMTCRDEDVGPHTSICINNTRVVVEVSNCSTSTFKAYKVGRVKGDLLQWKSGVKGVRYGMGKAPQISLSEDGYVVEVDEETDGRVSCRVGMVHSSNMMIWTEASTFTTGSNPTVALCHRTVIAAFKRADDAFYRIGTLDANERCIAWSTQEHRFLSGVSELTITSNHNNTVVAVYTKQMVTSAISSLYATVGELSHKEKKILFSGKISLQSLSVGTFPSVAMNRGNNVVMLSVQHKGIQKKIKYKLGLVKKAVKTNACDVVWSSSEGSIDFAGTRASVTMNDKGTVLVSHSKNDGECFCHIGKVHHETTI